MQSSIINRKPAKNNEQIEYCEEMLLHKSSQSKIALVPFFIRHSDPNQERDLSIKVIHYKKQEQHISKITKSIYPLLQPLCLRIS